MVILDGGLKMLSGIYKFENNENGKIYIGQAQNLGVRYNNHFNNHNNENLKDYNTKFYRALRKYGFHNFTYEILELVDLNNLNAREEYWIEYFDSFNNGYNGNKGGDKVTERGEDHPCSKLSNKEVEEIKDLLKNTNISQYQIADKYKVSQSIISEINTGEKWSSIGSNDYPIRKTKRNRNGQNNPHTVLNDSLVQEIRKRYVNETGKQIFQDYQNICSYTTFERALTGRTYQHLPIYKKKEKIWIKK